MRISSLPISKLPFQKKTQNYKKQEKKQNNNKEIILDQSKTEEKNLNSKSGELDRIGPLCGGRSNPRGGAPTLSKPDLEDSTLINGLNSGVQRVDSELSVTKGNNSLDQKEKGN
ncbi:hypothetical protein M0812_10167 [Anaeramoeba flamelloides]|uniref:Uncharacterized protein n=1 Tax=Anaeramoeba flamelloides TaxID=1746091 RepID=A0AAV7ZQS5_9EUKA|nr:hypothetical protein M0812_10167 [Anaeramoeba flamelloides]